MEESPRPRADRIEMDISWSDEDDRRASAARPRSEPVERPRSRRGAEREEHASRPASSEAHPRFHQEFASRHLTTRDHEPVSDEVLAHSAPVAAATSAIGAGESESPSRRTVVIRGQGTRGYTPARGGYETRLRPHERTGFKPDRVALWAVLLGLALLLGAVTSSHAAVLHGTAGLHHLLVHHTP